MCGICGIISPDITSRIDRQTIESMCQVIAHRGPDESGIFIDGHVGLGHRRLSIVDLNTGQQPMSNEDGTIWIVYNGEVYNHRDYVNELKDKGHIYKSTSDTETLIHLYEEYGLDFVEYLRGMFAACIFDKKRNRLVLIRDRIGIKPLYYHFDGTRLIFASEIKAILDVPYFKAELNQDILPQYFCNRFTTGEDTFFKEIKRLLPGHRLIFENGRIDVNPYWEINDIAIAEKQQIDLSDAVDQFLELFRDSVRLRLMSDVPLGLFLSGGIDSSAICAVMSEMVPDRLETFSVGFREGEANELNFARLIAKHYNTKHREIVLDSDIFFRALPELIWQEDEPIAFPSSIPLYFVSQLARSRVKVVLTGEGSDELLGGYAKYYKTLLNFKWGKHYHKIPGFLRNGVGNLIRKNAFYHPFIYKMNRTFMARSMTFEDIYLSNFSVFFKEELSDMLINSDKGFTDPYNGYMREIEELNGCVDLADQMLLIDLKTYLQELLMKQDQMSMAASIESRVPFLDHHIIEWVTSLPSDLKVKGRTTKILLRLAMNKVGLPEAVLNRSKMGFPVPLDTWFKGIHRDFIKRTLLDGRLEGRNLFRMEYIRRIVEDHCSGRMRNGDRLWNLINFELWARRFLDDEATEVNLADLAEEAL